MSFICSECSTNMTSDTMEEAIQNVSATKLFYLDHFHLTANYLWSL